MLDVVISHWPGGTAGLWSIYISLFVLSTSVIKGDIFRPPLLYDKIIATL